MKPLYVVLAVTLASLGLIAQAAVCYFWLRALQERSRSYGPYALVVLVLAFLAYFVAWGGMLVLEQPSAVALIVAALGGFVWAVVTFAGFFVSLGLSNWAIKRLDDIRKGNLGKPRGGDQHEGS